MARDRSPIVKQSRREGYALHPKAHKIMAKKSGIPGMHAHGRQGKQSMYAQQLREKQKVRRLYEQTARPANLAVSCYNCSNAASTTLFTAQVGL
jgi:ribosomal protein S4